MKKKFPTYTAGFDLVDNEHTNYSLLRFANRLNKISSSIALLFHAGETNWYGINADENLVDAILLRTKRIGHAYTVTKHPLILEIIKQRKIAIEICPISNQMLGLVKDLRNHPASVLFAGSYPVVVSNDDPSVWGAKGLSYDFYEAFMGIMSAKADIRALKQLAMNSLEYSFFGENEKLKAFNLFNKQWSSFIRELIIDDTNGQIEVSV